MPSMKSLSLTVQKLWPRLKFFATESHTGQKLDAWGIKKFRNLKYLEGHNLNV